MTKSCNCDNGYIYVSNKVIPCQCLLDERANKLREKLYHQSNVDRYKSMKLETYSPITDRQKQAYNIITQNPINSYYLYGSFGVGKTHLAAGTCHYAIANSSIPSIILSLPMLLHLIRKSMNDNTVVNIEEKLMAVKYLVIDDIGKERLSDWVQERLYLIIDERWRMYINKTGHTTLTSQHSISQLASRLDSAIVSRIKGMTKEIFLDGHDYRCNSK